MNRHYAEILPTWDVHTYSAMQRIRRSLCGKMSCEFSTVSHGLGILLLSCNRNSHLDIICVPKRNGRCVNAHFEDNRLCTDATGLVL